MRLSLFIALVVATIALSCFNPARAEVSAQFDDKAIDDLFAELADGDNTDRHLRTLQQEDEEGSIQEERAGGTALETAANQFAALGKGKLAPIDKTKLASEFEKMKSVAKQFAATGKGQLKPLEQTQEIAIAKKLSEMEKPSNWKNLASKLEEAKTVDTANTKWQDAWKKLQTAGFKGTESQAVKFTEGAAAAAVKNPSKFKRFLKTTFKIVGGAVLVALIIEGFYAMASK
ncbi:unnamed protein product [Phytophthora lilii]|uniref:RxLR effector protein n=1 Tax=Phytophthora lilii TaxID=2077276 RepID=A0A9W6UEX4_9STRA|nr:unnamed protein product [Phytophthora lilii]